MTKFNELIFKAMKFMTEEQLKDASTASVHKCEVNGKQYMVLDGKNIKVVLGEDYNFVFDKNNGDLRRWGRTYEDDPDFSPVGGEILDIEVTTACQGINGKVCDFCYKSNTPVGKNMSFFTFKNVIDKIGKQLTQVAFGVDSMASSNPDLWAMTEYCRKIGVIPNITVADISDEVADKLAKVMGAVSVSRYADKNVCYNSIHKLTSRGMKQVNMHFMISEETYEACLETLNDIKTDHRLSEFNAIVFLSLKQKGRGEKFTPLTQNKYETLVKFCIDNEIKFGMDSCGAKKFLDAVKDSPEYEVYKIVCEPCESTLFSQYVDVDGDFYPCSFCEGIEGWNYGIRVTEASSFLKDIWYNDKVVEFRNKLTNNCNNCHKARECPVYKV